MSATPLWVCLQATQAREGQPQNAAVPGQAAPSPSQQVPGLCWARSGGRCQPGDMKEAGALGARQPRWVGDLKGVMRPPATLELPLASPHGRTSKAMAALPAPHSLNVRWGPCFSPSVYPVQTRRGLLDWPCSSPGPWGGQRMQASSLINHSMQMDHLKKSITPRRFDTLFKACVVCKEFLMSSKLGTRRPL